MPERVIVIVNGAQILQIEIRSLVENNETQACNGRRRADLTRFLYFVSFQERNAIQGKE
jgi:hypothetical protein